MMERKIRYPQERLGHGRRSRGGRHGAESVGGQLPSVPAVQVKYAQRGGRSWPTWPMAAQERAVIDALSGIPFN